IVVPPDPSLPTFSATIGAWFDGISFSSVEVRRGRSHGVATGRAVGVGRPEFGVDSSTSSFAGFFKGRKLMRFRFFRSCISRDRLGLILIVFDGFVDVLN